MICPICEMQLPDNNRIMNRHIDACLNQEFIKNETRQNQAETSKEEDKQPQTKDKKKISQSTGKSRRYCFSSIFKQKVKNQDTVSEILSLIFLVNPVLICSNPLSTSWLNLTLEYKY